MLVANVLGRNEYFDEHSVICYSFFVTDDNRLKWSRLRLWKQDGEG